MEYLVCACIGYGFGCLNPAYFISKIKHTDIRKKGTGNLGTTNAFLNFGKTCGCLVLFLDMFKAFAAVKICQGLFGEFLLAGVVAGCMAVIGHIFPFYTGFRGGKGIASFGGFILSVDWRCFLLLLLIGCIAAFLVNYGYGISFSAAALFPLLYSYKLHSVSAFWCLLICSVVIVCKHMDNLRKIKEGEEMTVRKFLRKLVLGEKKSGRE